jgi:hypothetical protein
MNLECANNFKFHVTRWRRGQSIERSYVHETAQHRTTRTCTITVSRKLTRGPSFEGIDPWIVRSISAHSCVWDMISILISEMYFASVMV